MMEILTGASSFWFLLLLMVLFLNQEKQMAFSIFHGPPTPPTHEVVPLLLLLYGPLASFSADALVDRRDS